MSSDAIDRRRNRRTLEKYLSQARHREGGRDRTRDARAAPRYVGRISATYDVPAIFPECCPSGASSSTSAVQRRYDRPSRRLATLAWDPRRSALFRRGPLDTLKNNRQRHRLASMKGSWAGAMGQVQIMSVQLPRVRAGLRRRRPPRHLVDGGGRAARRSRGLRSRRANWTAGESWGREVAIQPEARRRIWWTRVDAATARARRDAT